MDYLWIISGLSLDYLWMFLSIFVGGRPSKLIGFDDPNPRARETSRMPRWRGPFCPCSAMRQELLYGCDFSR